MVIVKSFSVGDGDMFYIRHGNDNFTIIDCCLPDERKEEILYEIKNSSSDQDIIRFISTHPDDDHISGLSFLYQEMNLPNFYCVNNKATKPDYTEDFNQYCSLRDNPKTFYLSRGCKRKWLNDSDENRGGSGISILWPDTANRYYRAALIKAQQGKSPNNISPIIKYSLADGAKILWMGDLENNFMDNIKGSITMGEYDIAFAPHHGRATGRIPSEWLRAMNPKIIIVGEARSEELEYYAGYDTLTQNSAGDITLYCETGLTHIFVSNRNYSVNFLYDLGLPDTFDKYIGTLYV